MLAARAHQGSADLRLESVPVPSPCANECLIEVIACGLCGSDLHILDGRTAAELPVTLGHEAAGVVRRAGEFVDDHTPGSRVFIDPILVCGFCAACRSGRPHICRRRRIIGVNRDGAFAQFVAVPATNLVPLPDTISLDEAAMVESASTAFHALANRVPAFAGEGVAIIGVGGIGFHAVAIARLLGAASVVAVDVSQAALARALEHGATAAFDARDPDVGRKIRGETDGGVAVVAECVGAPAAQETAFSCLRRGGAAVLVGVGNTALAGLSAERLVTQELEVRGSFAYGRDEIENVIRLVAAGHLNVSRAITERYPLKSIQQAVDSFRGMDSKPVRVLITVGG